MFERENRYTVLKNKDAAKYLNNTEMYWLNRICAAIREGRFRDGRPEMKAVIVEADWPEYEPTWEAIKRRMEMKTFETREQVDGMMPCMKRPIVIHAKQINEPFRVKALEGDYKQGKPGDYLMTGIEGEHYICDREIFEKTYDFVRS